MIHTGSTLGLLTTTAVLLLPGCGPGSSAKKPKPRKAPWVAVETAQRSVVTVELETTGAVAATNEVTLQATVEGPVAFFPWREGDEVGAGARLVEIDRPLYRREVQAARATLAVSSAKRADLEAGARQEEVAQAEESVRDLEGCTRFADSDLERVERLAASGSIPGETAEKARVASTRCQTQLAAAKGRLAMLRAGPTPTALAVARALEEEAAARLGIAEARLAECSIAAPFSGTVTKAYVRPGDLATARAPLLELLEASSLVVRIAVPESQASAVRAGLAAEVRLDAYPGRVLPARVTRVYPALDPATRTRTVEATLTEGVALLPGMFARVHIVLERTPGAVLVPRSAVRVDPKGGRSLFVVEGTTTHRRVVRIGAEQGRLVHVIEGVADGELVVVAGNERLKDGATVRLPAQGLQTPSPELPQGEVGNE